MTFFNSKYPIVAVGMNKVSDAALAIACHRAGIVPTISSFNNYEAGGLAVASFQKVIEKYVSVTGVPDLIVSLAAKDFLDPQVFDFLCDLKISHVELLDGVMSKNIKSVLENKTRFNQHGGKVLFKVLNVNDQCYPFDGFIIKGPDGAGRTAPGDGESLDVYYNTLKTIAPDAAIIPSGGISTSQQVKYWIDKGVVAVGIGSLFAASKESPINLIAKERIVEASSKDLQMIDKINQRALVFTETEVDGINNTRGLWAGVRTGLEGHLFMGRGVDNITEILSVNEIVKNLIKDL
jgi:NAD(P)H-dependent flavin oxidoreductase YrpB (nitropropane dioxygenase family)